MLQEIMLLQNDVDILSCINDNYNFVVTPSTCNDNVINCGRPKGGLVIFFKKSITHIIQPIPLSDRFLGIKLKNGSEDILLINAYFPCEYGTDDSFTEYRSAIASLSEIIENEDFAHIIVCGDMNADPSGGRHWVELQEFLDENSMICADLCLPVDSFTYLSTHDTTRWLDHILTSNKDLVFDIDVINDKNEKVLNFHDHFPLEFKFHVEEQRKDISGTININEFIQWETMHQNDKKDFERNVKKSLDNYLCEAFFCNKNNCTNLKHTNEIKEALSHLKETLRSYTESFKIETSMQNKIIPGWNVYCREVHATARQAFLAWVRNGRIRNGVLYDNMKTTRQVFKEQLEICKRNENDIKKQKLVESFRIKNKTNFWKDVKKLKGKSKCFASLIDGQSEPKDMVEAFNTKLKKIFDDKECQVDKFNVAQRVSKLHNNVNIKQINKHLVRNAIKSLNTCIGFDNLHSNHFKFAVTGVENFLSNFFNAIITHSFFPKEMLEGEIRPLVKDHKGDLSSSDNYRPVMISSNIFKIYEYCILPSLTKNIELDFRQIGFQKNTSTNMVVVLLKETISKYVKSGSSIFSSFLDMSKAFDKINHFTLLDKLSKSNIPPGILKSMYYMYRNQNVHVRFKNVNSSSWTIGNGARQGSVISPLLFSLYINNVIKTIANYANQCKLGLNVMNILAYADDLTLIAATASDLQILINKLHKMLKELNLNVNTKKTVCMIFKAKSDRRRNNPNFSLNNDILKNVSEIKYLGVTISNDLTNKKDIVRCDKSFLAKFHSIIRKFSFADKESKLFLFKSHCLDYFGAQQWSNFNKSIGAFKHAAINYHKALKIIHRLSFRSSNHDVCEQSQTLTFKHLINLKLFTFAFQLMNSKSQCILPHIAYLKYNSMFVREVQFVARSVYNIENLFSNDIDAIKSRILFIQAREDRYRRDQ
jgi:hypothetical protein